MVVIIMRSLKSLAKAVVARLRHGKKQYIIEQNDYIRKDIAIVRDDIASFGVNVYNKFDRNLQAVSAKSDASSAEMKKRIDELEERLAENEKKLDTISALISSVSSAQDKFAVKFTYVNPELASLIDDGKRRVLLCGFYGGYNLGDELMLETLLDYLSANDSISVTVMLANNEDYCIYKMNNVHFIHYPQTRYDFDRIASFFDTVIFGGGALISGGDYDVKYMLELSLSTTLLEISHKMIEKGKRCIWAGLSTDVKLENKEFVERLRETVPHLDYFSVRDSYSLKTLEEAGVDVSKVKLAHDIILANRYLDEVPPHTKEETLNVGVIFICSIEGIEETDKKVLNALIDRLEGDGVDYKITLFPFYDCINIDETRLKNLVSDMDPNRVVVNPYVNTFKEIADSMSKMDCIISMRYHGALLAALLDKPLLTLILDSHPHYINKMNYLCDTYDATDNSLNISQMTDESLTAAFDKLFGETAKNDNSNYINEARNEIRSIVENLV